MFRWTDFAPLLLRSSFWSGGRAPGRLSTQNLIKKILYITICYVYIYTHIIDSNRFHSKAGKVLRYSMRVLQFLRKHWKLHSWTSADRQKVFPDSKSSIWCEHHVGTSLLIRHHRKLYVFVKPTTKNVGCLFRKKRSSSFYKAVPIFMSALRFVCRM